MKIYNTLNKEVEEFIPFDENEVKIYTCGPTVYHYAHIGNLRTYIFEDVLEKSLRYLGYNVKRVMNITDVGHLESDSDTGEDKMEKSATQQGKTIREIADYYTEAFYQDAEKLNIRIPDIVERASEHVDVYIKMIEKLLEDGFAYVSENNVYFDISKFPDYYKLSGKDADELLVGAREGVEVDPAKKNQSDFALWFTSSKFKNQEMKWDSPWGAGYPGWHIECSGIATKFLGDKIDIHCGGVDNIFPHHSNEIAQSEAYHGSLWCKYWVHGEHLNDEEGKMSKSKGETLTLNLLVEKGFNPLVYRLFCLGSHYRNQLSFSFEKLEETAKQYDKLRTRIKALDRTPNLREGKIDYYQDKFKAAIKNDLNTSNMLTCLYDVLKDEELTDFTKLYLIDNFDQVLSLDLIEEEKELSEEELKEVEKQIVLREEAKSRQDYVLADKIRDELLERGIKLVDSREGSKFEIID